MISRLFRSFSKSKSASSLRSGSESVSLEKRCNFVLDCFASVLPAHRLSTGLCVLPATDANAPEDAVLDAWRKELGTTSSRGGNSGDISFLLLKNLLYWGSVALSLYLIFTVFSFF